MKDKQASDALRVLKGKIYGYGEELAASDKIVLKRAFAEMIESINEDLKARGVDVQ